MRTVPLPPGGAKSAGGDVPRPWGGIRPALPIPARGHSRRRGNQGGHSSLPRSLKFERTGKTRGKRAFPRLPPLWQPPAGETVPRLAEFCQTGKTRGKRAFAPQPNPIRLRPRTPLRHPPSRAASGGGGVVGGATDGYGRAWGEQATRHFFRQIGEWLLAPHAPVPQGVACRRNSRHASLPPPAGASRLTAHPGRASPP